MTAVAIDSRTIQISWDLPNEEERNGIIRQYIINITELNSGFQLDLVTNATSILVENLHPHYQYSYQVAAETIAVGPWSEPMLIQMPEDGM